MKITFFNKIKNHLNIKNKVKGSITVEASFVMPLVLLSIFALIYLAFYLHDKNQVQTAMDLSLQKAGFALKHKAEINTGRVVYKDIGNRGVFYFLTDTSQSKEEAIKKLIVNQLSTKFYLLKVEEINVKVAQNKITATVTAKAEVPLPFVKELFKPYNLTIISEEHSIHDPAEMVRCMEVILETGSKIKGISQLKDKFNEVLN